MRETGIMVREPAVQIINCVKALDLERPAVRYVVYSTVQYCTVQYSIGGLQVRGVRCTVQYSTV